MRQLTRHLIRFGELLQLTAAKALQQRLLEHATIRCGGRSLHEVLCAHVVLPEEGIFAAQIPRRHFVHLTSSVVVSYILPPLFRILVVAHSVGIRILRYIFYVAFILHARFSRTLFR